MRMKARYPARGGDTHIVKSTSLALFLVHRLSPQFLLFLLAPHVHFADLLGDVYPYRSECYAVVNRGHLWVIVNLHPDTSMDVA